MLQPKTNNYEKVFDYYKELFLKADHERIAGELDFTCTEESLLVPYFGKIHMVQRSTGLITAQDGGSISVDDRLIIMHHIYYYTPGSSPSGEFIAFREINECSHFEKAFISYAVKPFAESFSGKTALLKKAMEKLGATPVFNCDAGCILKAFPKIPLKYLFWDKDEEFPASANILFDSNVTKLIHPESVPSIGGAGVRKLTEQLKYINNSV